MRITAAVARNARGPFSIEALELEEPRGDEILVRIIAAGLSHTDLLARDQDLPVPLPAVLGHEGAGRVERVGALITRFAIGDRVILTPAAAACDARFLAADVLDRNLAGSRPDGSSPLRRNTERIAGAFFGQSSLATHALVTDRNAVKIDEEVPFPVLAPLGGDVQTGAGTVINALRPRPGAAIAIFGAGAVGLSAVMAACLCGCHPIIAVDIKASRLQLAESIGATHTIDPDGLDPVEAIRAISRNGADFSVETTGLPEVTSQAVECLNQTGVCAVAGIAPTAAEVALNLNRLRLGRTVRGTLFGDSDPTIFVPCLVEFYRQGRLPIDRLKSGTLPLADINAGFDRLADVAAVRQIVTFPLG